MGQKGKFRVSTHLGHTTAIFMCPGCDESHAIRIAGEGAWGFNDDYEKPTITPSILVHNAFHCHSYITDGRIQFLGDCKHALKGQTVDLPELPEWMKD